MLFVVKLFGQLSFAFFEPTLKLAVAFSDAPHQLGQLVSTEEKQDHQSDDDPLVATRHAEHGKGKYGEMHGTNVIITSRGWVFPAFSKFLQQSGTRLCCGRIAIFDSKSDRLLKHVEVDVFESPKFDAIPRDAGLADGIAERFREVGLVFDSHDVNRDPGLIGAQTDLKEVTTGSVGVLNRIEPVSDHRV